MSNSSLIHSGGIFMEWKSKIDECCADELEEMITNYVKAGFLSDHEILEECKEYIEDNYPDDCKNITEDEFSKIIKMFRDKFQNTGNQENFMKLDSTFQRLTQQGVISLHYAGYTQDEGFADCNEVAAEHHENGEKIIGCCFYTEQDLEHILHEESALLYLSFGSYFEKPTAKEVGQIIVQELEKTGFTTKWDETAETKIAIKDFKWDKHYITNEQ